VLVYMASRTQLAVSASSLDRVDIHLNVVKAIYVYAKLHS